MTGPGQLDISAADLAIIRAILARHVPDRTVWAFGSRVTGNARKYSDLDLCIVGEQKLALSVSAALAEDFSESDLPFKVDLVDWAVTNPMFRDVIDARKTIIQQGA